MKPQTIGLPLLASLLALGFTFFATWQLDESHTKRQQEQFAVLADQTQTLLQASLSKTELLLRAGQQHHSIATTADALDFMAPTLDKFPLAGLRNISLAPLIQPEQLDDFVAQQRMGSTSSFTLYPVGKRPFYAPITRSIGEKTGQTTDTGRDLFADQDQQKALTEARDSGAPALSGRVLLKNPAGDFQPGFIIAAPIFGHAQAHGNLDERRAHIEGWLVAAFTAQEWLQETLGPLTRNLDVELDTSPNSQESRLYPANATPETTKPRYMASKTLQLGNQSWTLRMSAHPEQLPYSAGNPAKPVGLLGIILSAALFYLSMMLSAKKSRAETELERLKDALQEAEERWRFALEGSGDGVWEWDIKTGQVSFSPRCDAILGVADGNAAKAIIHPEDEARERSAMQACLDGKSSQYTSEHRMQSQDGSWRWIAARGMVVARTFTGTAARMIGTMSDITERKTANDRMQDMAQLDAQTGLPNRTLFFDRLQQALRMAKRKRETLALVCLDVDNFKAVNDNFGQAVGNKLLRELAMRLSQLVRDSDSVAHFGEDDFVILLSSLAQESDAHLVTEKILRSLAEDFVINNRHINITVSLGAALFPQHARSAETLLSSAQRARQQAFKSGGNTVCFSLTGTKQTD